MVAVQELFLQFFSIFFHVFLGDYLWFYLFHLLILLTLIVHRVSLLEHELLIGFYFSLKFVNLGLHELLDLIQ